MTFTKRLIVNTFNNTILVYSEDSVNIIASGGVSSMDDVIALRDLGIYGAIIGKAYYTGAINLADAIKEANL